MTQEIKQLYTQIDQLGDLDKLSTLDEAKAWGLIAKIERLQETEFIKYCEDRNFNRLKRTI